MEPAEEEAAAEGAVVQKVDHIEDGILVLSQDLGHQTPIICPHHLWVVFQHTRPHPCCGKLRNSSGFAQVSSQCEVADFSVASHVVDSPEYRRPRGHLPPTEGSEGQGRSHMPGGSVYFLDLPMDLWQYGADRSSSRLKPKPLVTPPHDATCSSTQNPSNLGWPIYPLVI